MLGGGAREVAEDRVTVEAMQDPIEGDGGGRAQAANAKNAVTELTKEPSK
jgi:hypothetical protein